MEIKNISSLFKGPIDKLFGTVSLELKQTFSNRLLEYQVEEYKRNYYSKTILHRAEPKPLNEFYQPLFISQAELKAITKRISTSSAKKLLNKYNYITIIGKAGSGKSTIVKYLFTNCFTEGYKIPIKVELRYLNEFKGTINDYIFNEIFQFQKLGFSSSIIDRLLSSDSFVFFLDGYDELNSSIKSITTKNIDSFVQKYPGNKYVITSRPYTSIDLLPLFTNFYVCDLEMSEIGAFVKKQIPSNENELAEKIIKAVNKAENRSYQTFLSNPLLLSMFILTFQSYSDIPHKRSEFYDQVFDTLFSIHDSVSKLAYVREKQSGLSKDQFEEILQLFSFLSFFEEKFLFPSNYLTDKLDIIKSKKKNLTFDNDKFIEDLQVAIGILNKEGLDYTFPHRSLQEYFAASYISKLSDENKKLLYEKLKKEIELNFGSLMAKDHFYGLLAEIDYNNLSLNVSIPFIQGVFDELQKITEITDEIAYVYYGKLLLPFYILLKSSQHHKEIHNEIIDKKIKYIFYGIIQKNIEIPKNLPKELRESLNFELMKSKIKNFKECGQKTINSLVLSINDSEKSDSEIIGLI
ncbi:MAG: NACHT domain-containing protein [Spirosomataceae bacterium]